MKSRMCLLNLGIVIVSLTGLAGCESTQTRTIKHKYVPANNESVTLLDSPCIDEAKAKAKRELFLDRLVISDTYTTMEMDATKSKLVVVCSIDVELPKD